MNRKIRDWARRQFWIQERFNEFINWCDQKKFPLIIIFITGLLAFTVFSFLKDLFIMSMFVALGIGSMLYHRYIRTPLGIELITFGVVISGRLFGPAAAMVVGFTSLLGAELFTGSLQHKTIVSFLGILIMGFLTQFFSAYSVTTEGIILVIIYDAIIIPGYLALGSSPVRSALFVITHIAFNIWVFSTIAPVVYGILS